MENFTTTCYKIWRKEEKSNKIITLCKNLDRVLGGGIAPCMVTEFCGGPGTGKTQICLQLCVNVQLFKLNGDIGGKAVFIDTNQDFNPQRLQEIAEYMYEIFNANSSKKLLKSEYVSFMRTSILQNVWYIYCADHIQLLAAVNNVKQYVQLDRRFKLIVIDSFSCLMRRIEDASKRTSIVFDILTDLQELAMQCEISVVVTNEVTTRIYSNENWLVCPTLGDSYAHKINQRIILNREENDPDAFTAFIDKSVIAPKTTVHYRITSDGIRDIII